MTAVPTSNPFATRYFVPGAIPYLFPPSASMEDLLDCIEGTPSRRVAIVGPHGSGKSTLITQLHQHPRLRAQHPRAALIRLSNDDASAHRWLRSLSRIRMHSLVFIDGFEQLSGLQQASVRALSGVFRTTLIVSAHALPRNFVPVWNTYIDEHIERYVLATLLNHSQAAPVESALSSDAWRTSRARHGQNLRESLFDMFDWYRDCVDAAERDRQR